MGGAFLIILSLLQGWGCQRCTPGTVAVVISVVDLAETSRAPGNWEVTEQGDRLRAGNQLRTNRHGKARVALARQGEIEIGHDTLVRFTSPQDQQGMATVHLEKGTLLMTTTSMEDAPPLSITSPVGTWRMGRTSRSEVILDDTNRAEWSVSVGTASLVREQSTLLLEQGSSAIIQVRHGEALSGQVLSGQVTIQRNGQERVYRSGTSFADDEDVPINGEQDGGPFSPDGGQSTTDGSGTDSGRSQGKLLFPEKGNTPEAGEQGYLTVRRHRRTRLTVKAPGKTSIRSVKGLRHRLEPGTVIKVGGTQPLTLSGPGGTEAIIQPGSEVTFLGVNPSGLRLALASGRGQGRTTGQGNTTLNLPGGTTETRRFGRSAAFAATTLGPASSRVTVTAGAVLVTGESGDAHGVTADTVLLREGGPPVVTSRPDLPLVFPGNAIINDSARRASFSLRLPSAEGCKQFAVEVNRGARPVADIVATRTIVGLRDMPYGRYTWRTGCIQNRAIDWDQGGKGGLIRRRDRSATTVLPTTPPRSTLDSDGREFTVLYQNLLPTITLKWEGAPPAKRYSLRVFNERQGKRVFSGTFNRPHRAFRSGTFREGGYYWLFRTEGGTSQTSSRVTRFRVAYDNVMPSIHIARPRPGAAAKAKIDVKGTVTRGSSVNVNGTGLKLDGAHRFDQTLEIKGQNTLIFQVTSPRKGVQYYLRRLKKN